MLTWAVRAGHTVALLTLTLQHRRQQSLEATWDAATAGWSKITQGRAWVGDTDREWSNKLARHAAKLTRQLTRRPNERPETYRRRNAARLAKLSANAPVRRHGIPARYGLLGWVRANEATHSTANGWHPHIHAVLVFAGTVSPERVRQCGEEIYALWEKGIASKGYSAVREVTRNGQIESVGLDIKVSTSEVTTALAEYFVKQLALEATHGGSKRGRSKRSRTPFQILGDFQRTGDADDLDLWHEWERTSKGRKQLGWSEQIRELAGLAKRERTDEEIAEEEIGDTDLISLPSETWRAIRHEQVELLIAAEHDGLNGAITWLDERDVAYLVLGRNLAA